MFEIRDLDLCACCACWLVNRDATGCGYTCEPEHADKLGTLLPDGSYYSHGGDAVFSRKPCDGCGDTLPGARLSCGMIGS